MATSTAQRAGIWIIAVVLTVGTLAGFIAMILAPQNQAADASRQQAAIATYQKEAAAVQAKKEAQQKTIDAEADALSKQYFAEFNGYKSRVAKFNRDDAQKALVKTDIKVGTGEEISDTTTYVVYYVGWLPDGTIFDGSIEGDKLKAPLIGRPGGLIQGWMEGVKGMKMGGVRELTIPSEKAYGEAGQGSIPANSPLKFIMMPFKTVETISEPEIPQELLQAS